MNIHYFCCVKQITKSNKMRELVFSWAEDAGGKMVHVDSVDNGLGCGCFCPCCHEPLQARHGDVKKVMALRTIVSREEQI